MNINPVRMIFGRSRSKRSIQFRDTSTLNAVFSLDDFGI
jgi:hypothetical protein